MGRLLDLLRVPSISADPAHEGDMLRAAEMVADEVRRAGGTAEVVTTSGHPLVVGEVPPSDDAHDAPVVTIYGHYDVQPPGDVALWTSPPFQPEIRDGMVFARGATDDKGNMFMLLVALQRLRAEGRLTVRARILIDGEEESGGHSAVDFITAEEHPARAAVIFDSPMIAPGRPAVCTGLRGLAYFQGGRIRIPGFYDDVVELRPEERQEFARLPFNETRYRKELGAPKLFGESGYTTLERVWARPTFEVNGLLAGFTGDGAKTVIPASAMAKVSMRLVPNQDPGKIAQLFEDHLRKVAPKTVEVRLTRMHGGKPWMTAFDNPFVQAAGRAIERGFGARPVFNREGGSIPVVATFQEELGLPCVLFGVGLPDENAHAPDEKLDLGNFHGGILASAMLYEEIGALRA